MSYVCDSCGKRRQVGNTVSHANNRTKRVFNPNLKSIKILVNGASKRARICTRCIRSGKVTKAI